MADRTTILDESSYARDGHADLPDPRTVLQALVENVEESILVVDAAGRILFINREWPAVESSDAAPANVWALLPPTGHQRFRQALESACQLGKADQCEVRWIDGRWCSIRVAPLPEQIAPTALLIVRDQSHVRRAEQALRESENRFRQLAENVREVFWLMDWQQKRILYVTNAYERVWGRSVKNLYSSAEPWPDAVHPDDHERVDRALATAPENSGFAVEYRIVRPDGTQRWIHDRGFTVRDTDGRVNRLAGIAEDVTDQRIVESSLRMERKLLKRLLDLQERERRLLAYEIHDGFIQDLVGAKMLLESLQPYISADQPDACARRRPGRDRPATGHRRRAADGLEFASHGDRRLGHCGSDRIPDQ